MPRKFTSYWKQFSFIVSLFFISGYAFATIVAKSDILLHIVTQCVDPSVANYCANCMLPRADAHCSDTSECRKTNEVWALNAEYVAIRDIKMCGCPQDFIHGLAMPRKVVTGVEDPIRQEGIWQFAWKIGLERIEPEALALVVNPKSERTQNQLHVHILRLDKRSRESFFNYAPVLVDDLNHVWEIADQLAKVRGLNDYGVLVSQVANGNYLVLVSPKSPEALFTVWNCQ
jgi:CDP-diacylglycerol pyrophosphatase